jgi:ribosomal protein S27AE
MGRSYWFECPRCGYRAKVSGRADRGVSFCVQTILCRDCRELYDAVTRLKVPAESGGLAGAGALHQARLPKVRPTNTPPPTFPSALSRLPLAGAKRSRWLPFKLQCPVSALHRVRSWNDPDQCPKCGVFLEKGGLPYRLWD